jgi:RNA polymerase sigma factor (sigma-70 family)
LNNGQERKAIDLLYKKVLPSITQYIRKNSGNKEQAEDIFHDAIIKLIVKIRNNELPIETDFNAYLFTMAKNLWIIKAKRDQKIQYMDDIKDSTLYSNTQEDYTSVQNETSVAMESVLTSIGEKCKELLTLTFYMNFSLKEAALKLGISNEEVAKTNQYRCKKKMFEVIKNNPAFKELMMN